MLVAGHVVGALVHAMEIDDDGIFTVSLAWALQREKKSGGFVAMATRSDWIMENLQVATKDLLSQEQLLRISGDGTPERPGIDANNRLIWGQVFLWPEAQGDWRVLFANLGDKDAGAMLR